MKAKVVVLLVCAVFCGGRASAEVVVEVGDFVSLVGTLRDQAFGTGSGLYVGPSVQERADFHALADSLLAGDAVTADAQAQALDYEVVQFTDQPSGDVYLGVREKLNMMGDPTRGWGSYFVHTGFSSDVMIQAPHPLFDIRSWEVAATVFRQSDARGFLMAGAHRNANGQGTADVAHLTDTIFHEVHTAWNGQNAQTPAWQIHGFNLANHPAFPNDTDVVLSNGDGNISQAVVNSDRQFELQGFRSYAFNTLPVNDPLNLLVNDGVAGTDFAGLGATTNVQGQYSRGLGGGFVHIELAQAIRFDSGNRQLAADAITAAIVPTPATGALVFAGLACMAMGRGRRAAAPMS